MGRRRKNRGERKEAGCARSRVGEEDSRAGGLKRNQSPRSPKGPLQIQGPLPQPCTGFKLKSENLLPLAVRTCFLGGLSVEGGGETLL